MAIDKSVALVLKTERCLVYPFKKKSHPVLVVYPSSISEPLTPIIAAPWSSISRVLLSVEPFFLNPQF